MIRLLRDDGVEILVNTNLIRAMDYNDGKTVLSLSGVGEITVKNHPQDIVEKIRASNLGHHESDEKEDPVKGK